MDQDVETWEQVFQELIREVKPGHQWTLTPDKGLLPNILEPGWVQYQQRTFARFQCSSCSRHWASAHVPVLFHMHWSKGLAKGRVKVRVFAQRCKKCCQAPFEVPEFTPENVSRVLNNLVLHVLKKCYREGFQLTQAVPTIKEAALEGPHDSLNCEACLQGFCAQSGLGLATQAPVSPTMLSPSKDTRKSKVPATQAPVSPTMLSPSKDTRKSKVPATQAPVSPTMLSPSKDTRKSRVPATQAPVSPTMLSPSKDTRESRVPATQAPVSSCQPVPSKDSSGPRAPISQAPISPSLLTPSKDSRETRVSITQVAVSPSHPTISKDTRGPGVTGTSTHLPSSHPASDVDKQHVMTAGPQTYNPPKMASALRVSDTMKPSTSSRCPTQQVPLPSSTPGTASHIPFSTENSPARSARPGTAEASPMLPSLPECSQPISTPNLWSLGENTISQADWGVQGVPHRGPNWGSDCTCPSCDPPRERVRSFCCCFLLVVVVITVLKSFM
ncbi:Receptor-transporting protein 3 [Tupaia chinensis]|uniref:Receptor-transporting protein 3 n=2 Tax=Tupaia chinensis TaxID=246437 RepID=L8Y518_TUPCH|nr:Receptor-transporting protein 3 [Tupaia chinensis]